MTKRGLAVAVVKHSHHSPDVRGKDSARFSHAGARIVVFAGVASFVLIQDSPEPWMRALPVDVVLVEGYSRRSIAPLRFAIRRPSEAPRIVDRILRACPRSPRRAKIELDGHELAADAVWRFVRNLMELRGVSEVRRSE